MKVVLHYDAGPTLAQRVAALAADGLEVHVVATRDPDGFAREIADAEVIWHVLEPVTATHVDAAPRLRLVQKIGVGVNTIDLDAARRRGVAVCNMPGTNAAAVAEHALALMLAALRRIAVLDRATRAGEWWRDVASFADDLGEIAGRTVGLVGFGGVPRRLAPILAAMGARVLYTATSRKADAAPEWCALPRLLAESDVVSLHAPLTPDTERMIDARAISRMKRGAVLVNTARGGLVAEHALVDALRSGRIAAAGLDVFADEPVDPANPLLALDNVVVTPHLAWLTRETWARSLAVAVENCRRLGAGEALLHRVA